MNRGRYLVVTSKHLLPSFIMNETDIQESGRFSVFFFVAVLPFWLRALAGSDFFFIVGFVVFFGGIAWKQFRTNYVAVQSVWKFIANINEKKFVSFQKKKKKQSHAVKRCNQWTRVRQRQSEKHDKKNSPHSMEQYWILASTAKHPTASALSVRPHSMFLLLIIFFWFRFNSQSLCFSTLKKTTTEFQIEIVVQCFVSICPRVFERSLFLFTHLIIYSTQKPPWSPTVCMRMRVCVCTLYCSKSKEFYHLLFLE